MAKDKLRYRAVFISDLHLGSGGCRADELSAFLKRLECDRLYLVGDVIDMWRLKQRWYWPSKHNRVVDRVLKLARRGTRVLYIPGNHDEHARSYIGMNFGGVEIVRDAEHRTADGRRLYITHGDQFDLVVKHARLLSVLGGWAYDVLVVLNTRVNWVRRKLGLPYWSLSQMLKMRVKSAVNYIANFEDALIEEARRKGFAGVVCGHIHKAEIRLAVGASPPGDEPAAVGPDPKINRDHHGAREQRDHHEARVGIDYYNCGDWVESCTALVEHADGRLELIDGVRAVGEFKARRDRASQSHHADRREALIASRTRLTSHSGPGQPARQESAAG